jgi:hypothetical protein
MARQPAKDTTKYIVITSVHSPDRVMRAYAELADWQLILVGDRSGPAEAADDHLIFLDIDTQYDLGLRYPSLCPENHYARKNIGYLYAMAMGAGIIAETDDDNMPKPGWGEQVFFGPRQLPTVHGSSVFNIYGDLSDGHIWPRGFPLDRLEEPVEVQWMTRLHRIGIWQFLVDNHPDVDAIHRLVRKRPVVFRDFAPFALDAHVYSPINSQNTFWCEAAFPLMYLPMSVTFRFTDILRGYIAQPLLWEKSLSVGFGPATVWQFRNTHNLFKDFLDEIPMYRQVNTVIETLDSLSFSGALEDSLFRVYEALTMAGVVDEAELEALEAWNSDVHRIRCFRQTQEAGGAPDVLAISAGV